MACIAARDRPLSLSGLHAVGEVPAVVLPDPLGHPLGLDGTEQFERFGRAGPR